MAMLRAIKQARLLLPAVFTVLGTVILIGLGTWQMSRKAWKEGLIQRIDARIHAAPVDLAQALQIWRSSGDIEYLRVRVTGRFRRQREAYVYAVDHKFGPGVDVYTPLLTGSGRETLVNRGFVPESLKDPAKRAAGQNPGETSVTGLARRPRPAGLFTPPSDISHRMFYWPDFDGMRSAVVTDTDPVPFFIDAEADPGNPGGWPKGGTTILTLPNRHLEYALTWYGLAVTLIGVFFAFARARLRAVAHEAPATTG
jgi:surfeit locus 1 family protein